MLVLASASPRRRALLAPFVRFEVRAPEIDETPLAGETPLAYVQRLAAAKAAAVAAALPAGPGADGSAAIVLAADTTVDVDGAVVGKPVDAADARAILRRLSGRTHRVHTGVAVHAGDAGDDLFVVSTTVRFVPLSAAAIDWYVAGGEPMDAAGAYAIQGLGGAFVAAVDGSYSNVVGLPLAETLAALARAGLDVPVAGDRGPVQGRCDRR